MDEPKKAAPAVLLPREICLFLDLDGTLIDFADHPRDVRVDGLLIESLQELQAALEGALALISGRRIAEMDRILHPLRLPAAGVHGLERRDAQGMLHQSGVEESELHAARVALTQMASAHPGLLIEDKGSALAVHFRAAPHLREQVYALVPAIVAPLSPRYELLRGDMALEIKPAACDKGLAVESFMAEAPFKGRRPVYVGDDITDYDAFSAVENHAGVTVAVGTRVHAQWQLADPAAVLDWLRRITQAGVRHG